MTGYCPKRNANPGILDMTKRSKRLTRLPVAALSVAALALSATSGFGQSPQLNSVNDQTQTPIPGAGHDYQRMLGETVNFSNGSVSFKIGFPTPKERGITMPLGWSYNSASVETLDAVDGITPTWDNPSSHSWPEMDGWSLDNGVPHATVQVWSVSAFDPIHQVIPCNFESGMTFTDMSGVTHNLGTGAESAPNNGTGTYTCGANQPTPPANGDGQVVGTLDPNTASNLSTDQAISSSDFVVTDKDGTNYYFGGGINSQNAGSILFPTIEDRNGNVIVLTGGGYVDTSGKTIQLPNSNNSNSPFVVGNLTYTPTWGTTPVDYGISIAGSVGAGILCGGGVTFPTTVLGTRNTLSSLVLSNQESYSFSYGQYGLPSKIVYPDGGWVVYTWQLPAGFNEMLSLAGQQAHIDKYGNTVYTHTPFVGCAWQYQTPVLAARQVSFDGTHVAQTQSFTFVTNWYYAADGSVNGWTSKTATVTTTDNVSGLTSKTVYTYYPYYPVTQPYGTGGVATDIPLEQSIVYYDWGQSPGNGPPTGTPLKTVTKTWLDQFNMTSEITTDNSTGRVSGTSYGYRTNQCGTPSTNSFTNLVEQDDYDYGSSAGVMGPLAKRTLYNYYCFPVTDPNSTYSGSGSVAQAQAFPGLTIPPKVSNVTIEDGSGNIQAATQYLYDGYPNSQLSPATATQHDDSLYGTGMTIRGNVTSVTKCNPLPASPSASCSGPKVTYNYDITGQPASMTDGCGNAGGCSDVIGSNHTTTFSFADSPVGGNAPGNSNAYLTNITYPTVGNVALQKNFQYNYQLGYLTVAKDENGQPTNYYYNDPLNRLTQVNYPDLGVTKISYVDTAPSPTVTTQKLLSSSNQWETSVATMDGMEHLVTTQLTTDPNGTDTVATTYDGEGRAYTVTNPYRTSPNGTTQHHYDALGREIETVEPDGNLLQSCYDGVASIPLVANCSPLLGTNRSTAGSITGTWVDSTDENGNHWQRASDAFGRLTQVMEPNGASQAPTMETDYVYDLLSNLLSTNQLGGASGSSGTRYRSFIYNNLSQLTSSSNPETGTIGYIYDLNGNLASKTDARPITVNYVYDNINRVFAKNYSSGDPSACMQYDNAATGVADSYPLGRMTMEWTAAANSCPSTSNASTSVPSAAYNGTALAHDQMGRVIADQQCPSGGVCANNYQFNYQYDLAGGVTQFNNGMPTATNSPTSPVLIWGAIFNGADQLQALSVLSQPYESQAYPTGLIVAPSNISAPGYDPMGHLVSAQLALNASNNLTPAINVARQYDNRGRIVAEADGALSGTGGTGSAATSGTTTLTISGGATYQTVCHTVPSGPYGQTTQVCSTTPNTGNIYVTIGGFTVTIGFGAQADSAMASQLAADFNVSGSPVTALASGNSVTITAIATGTASNYPISITDSSGYILSDPNSTLSGGTNGSSGSNSVSGTLYSYQVGSYAPNGNILSHTDSVMGSWNFGYDTLNRLTSEQNTGVTTVSAQFANQNGCWTYDAFGNRTMEAYSTLSSTPCAPGANDNAQLTVTAQSSANNNQVAGITQYDPAGEVTYDGSNYYRYDGEGRLCAVDNLATGGLTQYIYDAGGARVAKGSLTSWPASCGAPGTNGFTLTSQYLLDLSGEQVTELNGAGTWQHSNAFEGGRLTATYDQNGLHFAIADPLGTKRVQALITTAGGATLDENCFSLPFGNNIGNSRQTNCQGPGVDAAEHHFTGKERDSESGNDYFGARYYASSMGRFLSPDWSAKAEPVPYARLDDPQSLNLYVYGGNNPLIHIDADGHCWPQWACNFFSNVGQRFANTWNYGYFKTNSQVNAIAKQGVARLKANGYSPEGLHKSDLLRAATLGAGAKSFQTYIKHHPNLEPYAGRTSGTGTPEENVQLRDRSHHMNEKGYGEAELDKSSSNPDAIRGREQQLIETNGGAQSTGGTSGNAINGIADSNPNKGAYMGAAESEFGAAESTGVEAIEILNTVEDIP